MNVEPASLHDTNAPKSILYVVTAATEAQDSSRRRSITSATVAFDRPNVCRAASDGENTPIAAPTRRHLSPTSAQTTKQGWVHEKRSSTEKPFLLGQRPERSRCLAPIPIHLSPKGPGETKAWPAGKSRLEVAEWPLSPAEHVTNEPLRWTGPTTPRFWRRLFARANLRWYLSSKGVLRGCSAVAVASERYWLSRTRISVVVVRGFWMSG